jgi:type II secretory pathway pseudopilin PulG
MERSNFRKGQSLVELLVGISLGTFIIGSAIGALVLTLNVNVQSQATETATALAREMIDTVRSVAEGRWAKIYEVADKGTGNHHHLVSPKALTGSVSITSGTAAVSGSGTLFADELAANDHILLNSESYQVLSVDSQTMLTLTKNYNGADIVAGDAYREFSVRSGDEPSIVAGNTTFTRYFTIENVRRTNCGRGEITADPETGCFDNPVDVVEDPITQKITAVVAWQKGEGDTTNVTLVEYITKAGNETAKFTDWQGGVRAVPDEVVVEPDTMYISIAGINATSTPGGIKLISESGAPTGGNIDAADRWAWNDLRGWIDMYETGSVQVTDLKIQGYAVWDGTTDYIALDCATSPSGDVCDVPAGTGNWGVSNDGNGVLFGYAWSDSVGWISFNCDQTSVGGGNNCASGGGVDYGVTIDTATGDFEGWAWSDTIGWISFNSDNCDVNGNGFLDVSCGGDDVTTPIIGFKTNTSWRPGIGIGGELVSSTFDTQEEDGVTFSSIMWLGVLGAGSSNVQFQFASSDTPDSGGSWDYIGPDGTSGTYYSPTGPGLRIPLVGANHTGDRYFRYKIYISRGVAGTTPIVEDVIITWN